MMVGSEEKRRLIDAYNDPDDRRPVARAVAGLLIVAIISLVGVSYGERDAESAGATADAAKASAKRVATGR